MLEMLREIKPKSLFCKQRFGQAVFDEFMKVPSLEQVCFRSPLSIDNIEGLCELPNLKLFNMSGANKLLSFEPLAKLKLKKLALNGTYASIEQLSSIKLPEGLEALSFSGTGNKKSVIEDLEFVAECASLKFVALFQLTVVNGGLKPLARLNNLEYLSLDDYRLKDWSLEDYKYIHSRLPQLNPITIKLAATDEEFQKHHRIR
ncbi:hypothetical protein GCM10025791_14500 [Halioxenophilus aromaticivorans]|uniref:Leucine-rich repeat domain-containing protein n=2 Tax=Halioxenophilus aromaticivorans TaxID=1306992 RepID=A0AAV3U1M0_9ALTE